MTDDVRNPALSLAGMFPAALSVWLLAACQAGSARPPAGSEIKAPPTPPASAQAGFYLEALDGMAPGDTLRQQSTLQAARGAWQLTSSPANTLRYALVLGTPGHDDSNPLEASRLLAGVLANPGDISADELRLAAAFQREFTARGSQSADLARMRLDSEARLRATETESQARINAMSAELTRLRRERDAIQEKLDAIADIEKSLMERDDAASAPPDSTTP
jgi:hypothetical protein